MVGLKENNMYNSSERESKNIFSKRTEYRITSACLHIDGDIIYSVVI